MSATTLPLPIGAPRLLPLRAMSDERLVSLVRGGDDRAFSALYERYRAPLWRYCRSIVRNAEDAGDAFQNAMLAALPALRSDPPSGRVKPWLYRIAHNESVSVLRRRRAEEQLTADVPERAGDESHAQHAERFESVLADIRLLPDRQRGALMMREMGGFAYGEIARALQMSEGAARTAVYEARVSLVDSEAGRETTCVEIMRRISDGDRRALRGRRVRAHLHDCSACAAFEAGLRERRHLLALLPILPGAGTGALLAPAVGGAGATIAGGASALGGGAAAIKCIAVCGAVAFAGAGAIVAGDIGGPARRGSPARVAKPHRQHAGIRVTAAPAPAALGINATPRTAGATRIGAAGATAGGNSATTPASVRYSAVRVAHRIDGGKALPVPAGSSTAAAPTPSAPPAATTAPSAAPAPATGPTAAPATSAAATPQAGNPLQILAGRWISVALQAAGAGAGGRSPSTQQPSASEPSTPTPTGETSARSMPNLSSLISSLTAGLGK